MNFNDIMKALKRYDFSFIGIAAVIFLIGVINLYSATHASSKGDLTELYKVQVVWFFLSVAVGVGLSFFQPKNYYRMSYILYFANIALLILVLVLGHTGMGATRWLAIGPFRFQPSESMKVCVVLALARFFSKENPEKEMGLRDMIFPFLIAFVPAALIIVEPDLGTGLLLILIFFIIAFYRKLKWKSILIVGLIGILSGSLMYKFALKDYQRKRILTFLDPAADVKGSGYNAIQSKIAIGSGQFFGKGFRKSSQASFNYLPENHTDFVFSVYNEEHGFFGSLLLISLYVILLFRFIWLANSVNRIYEAIVSIGLMAIFFWHTFINMGMVTGILPIVGLPLPLMSYGGSSLLTFGISIGIVTSFSNSRNLF